MSASIGTLWLHGADCSRTALQPKRTYNAAMCGIFGITENNEALARKACKCIHYRGPDSQGIFADESVSLGFNRLAIVDLDPRANQPMWDDEKKIALIYNGELYNFKKLRKELEQEYTFRTTSDTEVFIYAYKKWGPRCVEKFLGMFAAALYDVEKKRLFLFRDHAGIKPLIYYEHDGLLVFGSEMKAVLTALRENNISPKIDSGAVQLFYALGYIPSPRTLYTHCFKLPPSSYLEYDLSAKRTVGITRYSPPASNIASEKELAELVENSVLSHTEADVPVGVFFSGGTDSSLIASILHKHKRDLETFSIRVVDRKGDERYFTEISSALKLRANVFDFSVKEFNDVYEKVMGQLDEPVGDISIFPTYFVAQKAAKKVKVVLSGEAGDELFFGYARQRALLSMRQVPQHTGLSFLEWLFLSTPSFKAKNYLFVRLFALFRNPIAFYLLSMSPARDRIQRSAWLAAKRVLAEERDALYFDRALYLENMLLRKTDLATSYNSLEGRVPLLDPRIVSAAPRFEKVFAKDKESKPVLKRLLAKYLPEKLVYRAKSGFGMPLPSVYPHSSALQHDLDAAIVDLKARELLFVSLPTSREELVRRYPDLAFALVVLYRVLKSNGAIAGAKRQFTL